MAAEGVVELDRDRTLKIARVFDAPRELVFDAWTDPAHIAQWWGPAGFENTRVEIDFRVGGKFQLLMRAPDASVHPCTGVFTEIIKPSRIVYEGADEEGHPCGAGLPPRSTVTVTFEEAGPGKTKLTIETVFASADARIAAREARFSTSWLEGLERLAAHIRDY